MYGEERDNNSRNKADWTQTEKSLFKMSMFWINYQPVVIIEW